MKKNVDPSLKFVLNSLAASLKSQNLKFVTLNADFLVNHLIYIDPAMYWAITVASAAPNRFPPRTLMKMKSSRMLNANDADEKWIAFSALPSTLTRIAPDTIIMYPGAPSACTQMYVVAWFNKCSHPPCTSPAETSRTSGLVIHQLSL